VNEYAYGMWMVDGHTNSAVDQCDLENDAVNEQHENNLLVAVLLDRIARATYLQQQQ